MIYVDGVHHRHREQPENYSIAHMNFTLLDAHSSLAAWSRRVSQKLKPVWQFVAVPVAAPVYAIDDIGKIRLASLRFRPLDFNRSSGSR